MTAVVAAARKTPAGTKVYVHAGCDCHRINGRKLREIETVEQAVAYAAAEGMALTLCKNATVELPDTEAPAAPAPAVEPEPVAEPEPVMEVEEPAEDPRPVAEAAPEVETAPEVEEPAEEPQGDAEGHAFTVEVNNRDKNGKQRREAVAAMIAVLGGELAYGSIPNKNGTSAAAYVIEVTASSEHAERVVRAWISRTDAELPAALAAAQAAAKATDATPNERKKAWQRAVREWVVEAGQRAVEQLAASA
jgi:hypothetical protein